MNWLHVRRLSMGLAIIILGLPAQAELPAPLAEALSATKPIAEARVRLESVHQDPFATDASALSLRARLGFETGRAWGTSLLVEGEAVVPLRSHYNSTTNGRTGFPVVADPESYELNRLQLVNTLIADTTVTLGRQRIVLDDHRFVGNVGWRQNEQTFDALRVVNRAVPGVTIDLSYVNQVNRIFGPDGRAWANAGRFTGDSVLANVSWSAPWGRLTAFGYLVDIEQTPQPVQDSTQTVGLRIAGERPVSVFKVAYLASWATQSDRGENPLSLRNDFYMGELTASFSGYSLGAGYEVLEGDGTRGFATPLATLHRFQGWADKFLVTPANGIRDRYLLASHQRRNFGAFDKVSVQAAWHRFDSDRSSMSYGTELDLQLQGTFRRYTGTLKFSDYAAASSTPEALRDTRKLWAQIEFAW